jgi:ABC-type oligopeptide transport system substrate-binding subunit
MPEISDAYRVFTIRSPGIYFQDDPAFKGSPRELVAQDFVYAWKRIFDPRWKSPIVSGLMNTRSWFNDATADAEGKDSVRLQR